MIEINVLTRIGELISSLGAVIAAMGCAMCFPAIACHHCTGKGCAS